MAKILAVPAIFEEITGLKPELPEQERWTIANRIKEASIADRNYPPGLENRFAVISETADLLEKNGLPITVGNLQEQAFTTALQAYRWLWENKLNTTGQGKKRQVRVGAEDVRAFAKRMDLHHNRFRKEGIHSNLCQGSVLLALAETGKLEDFAEYVTSKS